MPTTGTLRDDELSRGMFYAGCFGLPWLWIVHSIFWYGKQKTADPSLLEQEDNPTGSLENPSPSEIAKTEQMWVTRGRNSAVIVTLAWIGWVVVVQVLGTDLFPVSWFVRTPDQGEYTGW